MTDYGLEDWEYSNEIDASSIPVTTGIRTLKIKAAMFTPETKEYRLTFSDVKTQAEFTLVYWLDSADENGNITPNTAQRGTLVSLGKALYFDSNKPVGIPMPCKVIGGVVVADIKMSKPNVNGTTFPRIYKFQPAKTDDVLEYSEIDQYSED